MHEGGGGLGEDQNIPPREVHSERKELRERYPLPKVPGTKTPQLDAIMNSETSAAMKATNKQLAKVQVLYLDAVAPLTSVVEAHTTGDITNLQEALQELKETRQAIMVTLQLLGNANAHMSHLRRERIIGDMNKSLLPIVGDDSTS